MIASMPWQRVEDVSEYRLNTKKLDEWLKSKWGDYDYEIEVGLSGGTPPRPDDMLTVSVTSTTTASIPSGPWSRRQRWVGTVGWRLRSCSG